MGRLSFTIGLRIVTKYLYKSAVASMCLWLLLLSTAEVRAHEIRPARLQITQLSDTTYSIFWKLPAIEAGVLKLRPLIEFDHKTLHRDPGQDLGDAYIQSWTIAVDGPIDEGRISLDGLANTITDVFVTTLSLDGDTQSFIIRPDRPYFYLAGSRNLSEVVKDFVILGVEHIWFGYDHLLFVLCLLWLIRGFSKLIKTITAFTIAHSITLAASTLGWLSLPGPPVEAIIALSIIFLAVEIINHQRGQEVYTSKYPWVVALSFGLLHGFGFAGALSEIGLPRQDLVLSLLGFNLGVELGQVVFVIVVILVVKMMNQLFHEIPKWISTATIYGIGSLASFWLIERVVGFW